MLIKQLRRNSILLTHSSQRFNLLLELFQSYEQFYQEQMGLNRLNSSLDASNYSTYATINFNTYYSNLHDSYQTIKDRIKKIYLKMDVISSSTEAALICENNNSDTSFNTNTMSLAQSNHIDLIKLFEYQIIEMQHEYELLLEDKVS